MGFGSGINRLVTLNAVEVLFTNKKILNIQIVGDFLLSKSVNYINLLKNYTKYFKQSTISSRGKIEFLYKNQKQKDYWISKVSSFYNTIHIYIENTH